MGRRMARADAAAPPITVTSRVPWRAAPRLCVRPLNPMASELAAERLAPRGLDRQGLHAVSTREIVDAGPQRRPQSRGLCAVISARHHLVDFASVVDHA